MRPGAIRTRPWIRAQSAGLDQVIEVNRAVLPITDHEPDLTLLTAGEGSRVYMRRWCLRRQLAGNGYGQDGLYVHVFDNDDPEGFHNHPWPSASLLLSGHPIFEDTTHGTTIIENRSIVLRPTAHRHRIRLRHGPVMRDESASRLTATTLFCTGKRVQEWGFEQPDGSIKPVGNVETEVRSLNTRIDNFHSELSAQIDNRIDGLRSELNGRMDRLRDAPSSRASPASTSASTRSSAPSSPRPNPHSSKPPPHNRTRTGHSPAEHQPRRA